MEIKVKHYDNGKSMTIHTSEKRCSLLGFQPGEHILHKEGGKGVVLGVGPRYIHDKGKQAGEDVVWAYLEEYGEGAVPLLTIEVEKLTKIQEAW